MGTNETVMFMQFESEKKSSGVAFLLCLFLGMVGAHRFYLGRTGSAVMMLFTFGGLGLWVIIDLFLLSGMVRQHNTALRMRLQGEAR